MRLCILYDCLFPWTVGGAERWYRNMAERLAAQGHEVTYLTLRQWEKDDVPSLSGVNVIAVGPRMTLYTAEGRRRIVPPLIFGMGVFWHLLKHGRRYQYVHTASFPFFSLLAAATCRWLWGYRIAVDWHEVWSADYWRRYLGPLGGRVGEWVQMLCARVPQRAFSFSRLHAARLRTLRGRDDVTVLPGEYAEPQTRAAPVASGLPTIVYAGRMIPEKQVPLLVDALALVMAQNEQIKAVLIGEGPELPQVQVRIAAHGLGARVSAPGFVDLAVLDNALRTAAVLVQPSIREGYGMVVIESAARGVPTVVVAGEDNAAVELIVPGINGVIAEAAEPHALASAIKFCLDGGQALRASSFAWYEGEAHRLSIDHSLDVIADALRSPG